MRRFSDETGRVWDVVAGRESWGAFFAIFVPGARAGGGAPGGERPGGDTPGIRQTPLRATGYDEANAELEALSEEDLRELLDRSSPKNAG